ncbi:MAG: cytochrome c1 [Gammaproteobacteria bacterium]|nr:cytochrome c1 [Gammaproteobacteria bacterium]
MKKHILILLLAIFPAISFAASSAHLDTAPIDIHDKDSIKRGAKTFADYCYSCHSAGFMRFNRIAKDMDMSDDEIREMMIFTRDKKGEVTKVGDLMNVAMSTDYAKGAFGGPVPDLSLTARSRGANWLYTYLRTFYADEGRPSGMNNTTFPDVGMPHVLWEQQGIKKPVYVTEEHAGVSVKRIESFDTVQAGSMTEEEYDAFVADLVNFMVYVAEPVQVERRELGVYVLIYLAIFFVFAYLLKKEYWKDVH